jgi:phage FluMu protein Com
MKVRCPHCGKLLMASERSVGKVARCPVCQKLMRLRFVVPSYLREFYERGRN